MTQAVEPSGIIVLLVTLFVYLNLGLALEFAFPGALNYLFQDSSLYAYWARIQAIFFFKRVLAWTGSALTYDPDLIGGAETEAEQDYTLTINSGIDHTKHDSEAQAYAGSELRRRDLMAKHEEFLRRYGYGLQDECAVCMVRFEEIVTEHEADALRRDRRSAIIRLRCNHVFCTNE